MSKGKRYPEEFKVEAVKQVTERGCSVMEVSQRLDISTKTLYHWVAKLRDLSPKQQNQANEQAEIARLKSELRSEERRVGKECRARRSRSRDSARSRARPCAPPAPPRQ